MPGPCHVYVLYLIFACTCIKDTSYVWGKYSKKCQCVKHNMGYLRLGDGCSWRPHFPDMQQYFPHTSCTQPLLWCQLITCASAQYWIELNLNTRAMYTCGVLEPCTHMWTTRAMYTCGLLEPCTHVGHYSHVHMWGTRAMYTCGVLEPCTHVGY